MEQINKNKAAEHFNINCFIKFKILLLIKQYVIIRKQPKLTMVTEDALGLFLWTGRNECSHKVVGERNRINKYKEQNMGLERRGETRPVN